MIHYHGTPITPRVKLTQLAGRNFCVSYAAPAQVATCHEIGQSVMLDNGAFSHWRQGREPDWPGYYEWAAPWLDHWTTWAVIPDVIDGDEPANDALINEWPFGTRGAPVWHLHESLDRLARLCFEWPLVCLGSSGVYATPGSPGWTRRMAEAMRIACDARGRPRTRLHMLRGLGVAAEGVFPFFSADSTNIARNHAGSTRRQPKDAHDMARAIDGVQSPALWRDPGLQLEIA